MEILLTLFTFAVIGGIARAAVIFVQWFKKQSGADIAKLAMRPELNQMCQRLNIAVQTLWVFIALVITAEFESSILNIHTFIIGASVSAPVIVYNGMRWVLDISKWSWWAFAAGLCLLFIGGLPLDGYMHNEQVTGTLSKMILAYCLFNVIGYFPAFLAYIGKRKSSKS